MKRPERSELFLIAVLLDGVNPPRSDPDSPDCLMGGGCHNISILSQTKSSRIDRLLLAALIVASTFDLGMTLWGTSVRGLAAEANPVVRGVMMEAGIPGLVFLGTQQIAMFAFAMLSRVEIIRRLARAGAGLAAIVHLVGGLSWVV